MLLSTPTVTFLYAGILALFYLALSFYVVTFRWKEKRGIGFDIDPKSGLFRAVRIHGNFMEFVPFIITLMALDEMSGRSLFSLHMMGISLTIGRLFHCFGILRSASFTWFRALGVVCTFTLLFILGINLILKGMT